MENIAYCPTMAPFADKISTSVKAVTMIEMGSAAQVLAALRYGDVNGVLIGRYAKQQELDKETRREILREGYTMVFKQKNGIPVSQLKELTVKTYLNKNTLSEFIPLFGEVIWYESFEACVAEGLEVPVLIDWKDYRDDFELLIPMNSRGKLPLFRAPVLYYNNFDSSLIQVVKDCIG